MEEKELKTSTKQRVVIIIIAIIMLGSIIASYATIIMNGGKSNTGNTDSKVDEAKILEYEEVYNKKLESFKELTKSDFNKFIAYKSEVKAYNEA
jgi:flagellar basal body-associated protein FliL